MSKSQNISSKFGLAASILVVCLLAAKPVLGNVIANIGAVFYVKAAAKASRPDVAFVYWQLDSNSPDVIRAASTFLWANSILPSSNKIQWYLARLALMQGKVSDALQFMPTRAATDSDIQFLERLVTESRAGNAERVIELAATRPHVSFRQVISDTLALAYIQEFETAIQSNHQDSAVLALQKVLQYRPYDLFANYWDLQLNMDDHAAAAQARKYLFPPASDGVIVDDPRIALLAASVVPNLVEREIWPQEQAESVVKYWRWRFPNLDEALSNQATGVFEGASEIGIAAQARQCLSSVEMSSELRQTVAALLGAAETDIDLGEELILGDTFSYNNIPFASTWHSTSIVWPFVGGRDSGEGAGVARIMNLNIEMDASYAEFFKWIDMPQNSDLLALSLSYKVEAPIGGQGFIYLGQWYESAPYVVHHPLPDTNGAWKTIVFVGAPPIIGESLALALRNWGAESVWFHNVSVRPVRLSGRTLEPSLCRDTVCITEKSLLNEKCQ